MTTTVPNGGFAVLRRVRLGVSQKIALSRGRLPQLR